MPTTTTCRADLTRLTAAELAGGIAGGGFTSLQVVDALLQRIDEIEPNIGAWAHLDPGFARSQARAADRALQAGEPIGPLHGVPVAIKDIIDTRGLPTENGTVLDEGRRPTQDAVLVTSLRRSGAIVLGKAATAELAYFAPAKTRNPHHQKHTPGGSSSGSAAAVAAHMAPIAVGTQTNGSMIRPASFCGVVGYKPTFGAIPRTGVLAHDFHLDTIGVFGRSVPDAALLAEALMGDDPGDRATAPSAVPRLLQAATGEPAVTPSLAFVRSPVWDQAADDAKKGFAGLREMLGERVDPVDLPAPFAEGHTMHRTLMEVGIARNLGRYCERGKERLSDQLRLAIERGRSILAHDYLAAVDGIEILNDGLQAIFEGHDAILTPAAAGEAPRSLETTGNPAFCTLWTLCGTPAISLPLLKGSNGLPIGVQLVGKRGDDARLFRTASWLMEQVGRAGDS